MTTKVHKFESRFFFFFFFFTKRNRHELESISSFMPFSQISTLNFFCNSRRAFLCVTSDIITPRENFLSFVRFFFSLLTCFLHFCLLLVSFRFLYVCFLMICFEKFWLKRVSIGMKSSTVFWQNNKTKLEDKKYQTTCERLTSYLPWPLKTVIVATLGRWH